MPGLSVVTAPGLGPLLGRLAEAVAADPLPPAEAETVLVAQNKGLRAWLTHGFAARLGCAAALDLRAPLTFATDLARALVPNARPEGSDRHPFDAGPLAWRLAPILDALPPDPTFDPLRAYLDRTGGQAMPLATRLAALLDDYQVYRPDILEAWARGEDPAPGFAHGVWQAALWRRLVADEPTLDRAAGLEALVRRLRLSETDPIRWALPTRVSVFGALLFPPLYLRALGALARHVPVTLYAVTVGAGPCREPHAHPLLRALCGRTRDFWTVLDALGAPRPERLAAGDAAPPAGEGLPSWIGGAGGGGPDRQDARPGRDARPDLPPPRSLPPRRRGGTPPVQGESYTAPALRQLQAALAADAPPAAPVPLLPDDRSVRVHDCHSPTRELEALRDALLDAFAETPGLRPSDVLVLVPDLGTYAPLVDAVLGAEDAAPGPAGGPGLRIPYHVVDHPHAPAVRVVEAFGRVLRLHDGRVTASELLDLLGTPAVRRAAGVAEDELPRLRAWAREAGVCWGLTAERRTRFGLPEDDLHTWRFGLDRLLLGVMTGPPAAPGGLVLGHVPCDAAGTDGADLLGRFCEWAEALFSGLDAIDRPGALGEWPGRLVAFLDGVLRPETDEEVEAVVFLREQAYELAHLGGLAGGADEAVPFRAVRAHLDGAAGRFERREPYLTGRVTVAHPLALRHAPHRVVAFVGLGDGVWPRPETPAGFDLTAHAPRPGDADPRALEKQLFVDAVLAAGDRLILSFCGRSQKDNSPRAASVCLDAFLDAARRHWGDDAERLVVEHRLQPFAPDYFAPGGPLASYAGQHRVRLAEAPGAFFDPAVRLDEDDAPEALSLAELAEAWTSPSRYVVRRRLRASLDLEDGAVRDDEPVALDALAAYGVREAVLGALLDGLDDAALADRLLRGGLLPGGAPGAAALRQAHAEAAPIAEAVRQWGGVRPVPVAVAVEGVRLAGTVERVGPRGALRYRAGSVRAKDLVGAWVDHLALAASGAGVYTCAVGTSGAVHFEPVPASDARALLGCLVRGWRRARRTPLPLYEHASHAYAETLREGELKEYTDRILTPGRSGRPFAPPGGAMKKARDAFDPWGDAPGDAGDAYVALAARGRDPFVPEEHFMKWALGLWAPLLLYRRDGVPA